MQPAVDDADSATAPAFEVPPRPLIASDASFKIGPSGAPGSQPLLLSAADKTAMLTTVQSIPLFRYRYVGGTTTQHTGPYAVTYAGSLGWNSAFPNGAPGQSSCLLDIGDVCGTLVGCVQALAGGSSGGQWTTFSLVAGSETRTGLTPAGSEVMLCVPKTTAPTSTEGRRLFYDGGSLIGGALSYGNTVSWSYRVESSLNFGFDNAVRASRSVSIGGYNNDVQEVNSFIVGGSNANVLSPQSGVLGGSFSNINRGNSCAIVSSTSCQIADSFFSCVAGANSCNIFNATDALIAASTTCTVNAVNSAIVGGSSCQLLSGSGLLCSGNMNAMTYGENSVYIGTGMSMSGIWSSLVFGGNQTYAAQVTNSLILGGCWSDGIEFRGTGGGLSNAIGPPTTPVIANAVYMGYGRNNSSTALSNCMTAIFNGSNASSSSFVFCTADTGTAGPNVRLAAGGNSWIGSCRRELKEDFQKLDEAEVTARLRRLPLYTYRFKGAADRTTGPVAEEWAEAMRGVLPLPSQAEEDPSKAEGINTSDALYAAIAAVKEAHRRIDSLFARDRHRSAGSGAGAKRRTRSQ